MNVFFSLLIPVYLAWVVKFVADMENYMNAVERVLEYTHLDNEEDMKKYPESIETCYEKGVVSFDGVYLGYYLDSRVVIGKKGFVILDSRDPKNKGAPGCGGGLNQPATSRSPQNTVKNQIFLIF